MRFPYADEKICGRRMGALVLGLALVAASLATPVGAQQMLPCDYGGYDPGGYSHVSRPGRYEIGEPEVLTIASKIDGVDIQMGIVRPKVPAGMRVPVIVVSSPYYHPLQTMDLVACEPFLINNFVPQGYAVVLLPVRGSADAGGCMNLMGPLERGDLDQAVTLVGTRPWSNGSVAMIGLSYDGSTPWMVAASGNPHLKTIVPMDGVPDLFNLLFGAGTPDWRGPAILNDIYYTESMFFYAPGRSPEHTVEVSACPEYAIGTNASIYSAATGLMDPTGYWEERRYRDKIVDNYRGSVFLTQGLQDWNVNPGQQFPWIKQLEDKGVYVKYILGQWGHSKPDNTGTHTRPDFADILLNWFDRFLKNDKDARLGPKAQVEDSLGRWRSASDWPQSGKKLRFWLAPEHKLAGSPSKDEATEVVGPDAFHTQLGYYTGMPPVGFETMCLPGCTYFETEELRDDWHIAGLPSLRLTVVPAGPGGTLSAYLYAVSGNGAQRLGWGQINLAFKAPGVPRPVTPGQEMKIEFDLQPLDAVAKKGSHLVLVISGGNGWNRLPGLPNYPAQLHEGRKAGMLEFVLVTPPRADFFDPRKGASQ